MQAFQRNVTFTAFDVSELCDVGDRGLSIIWERYDVAICRVVLRIFICIQGYSKKS